MRQSQPRVDPEQRQRRACQRKAYGIGQPQPARRQRDQDGEAEQAEGAKKENVHEACLAGRRGKGNRADRIWRLVSARPVAPSQIRIDTS